MTYGPGNAAAPGVSLIVGSEPLTKGLFGEMKPLAPTVAAVYDDGYGGLEWIQGRLPRRLFGSATQYRIRHQVTMGDHWRRAELLSSPLLARGDAYQFQTKLTVGFRVVDPVTIVRSGVTDALIVVYDYLLERFRPIARAHEIEDAGAVEREINDLFSGTAPVTPAGIEIFHCRVEVQPDVAYRVHRDTIVKAARTTDAVVAGQTADEAKAKADARLAEIAQQARLEQEQKERDALAAMPLDPRSLLREHLTRHPQDTNYALELLARFEESRQARQDVDDQRRLDLFRFMADRDLVVPADVERLRAHTLGETFDMSSRLQSSAKVEIGWDAPLPTAPSGRVIRGDQSAPADTVADAAPSPPSYPDPPTGPGAASAPPGTSQGSATGAAPGPADAGPGLAAPVYLLFDESFADPGYLAAVNEGLGRLGAMLSSTPEVIGAVRLAVLGFAKDTVVRMPLTPIASGGYIPPITAREGLDHTQALRCLLDLIPRDVQRLKDDGLQVIRPTVYLLCAGPRGIDADGRAAQRELTDRGTFRYAPNVLVCAIGSAPATVAADLATNPEMAYLAPLAMPAGEAATRYLAFLAAALAAAATAPGRGEQQADLAGPEGFGKVDDTFV